MGAFKLISFSSNGINVFFIVATYEELENWTVKWKQRSNGSHCGKLKVRDHQPLRQLELNFAKKSRMEYLITFSFTVIIIICDGFWDSMSKIDFSSFIFEQVRGYEEAEWTNIWKSLLETLKCTGASEKKLWKWNKIGNWRVLMRENEHERWKRTHYVKESR